MFNKDTHLIYEAYNTSTINEGKMKDIMTAIEAGDGVDEIISDLKLDDNEKVRSMITKARDDYYEKGEREAGAENEEDSEHQGGMGVYNLSTMDDKGRLQVMKMRLEDLIKDGGTFEEFARTVAYQRDLIKQNSEMEEAPAMPSTKHYMNF